MQIVFRSDPKIPPPNKPRRKGATDEATARNHPRMSPWASEGSRSRLEAEQNDLNHTLSAKRARRRVSKGSGQPGRRAAFVRFGLLEPRAQRSVWAQPGFGDIWGADQRLELESELGLARSPFRSHEVARLKQKGVPTLIETPKPQQPIHPTLHQRIDCFFGQFNLGAQVFGCCIRVIIQRLLGVRSLSPLTGFSCRLNGVERSTTFRARVWGGGSPSGGVWGCRESPTAEWPRG